MDPIDPLERELDGEGRRGIENTPNGFEGGGVEVIMRSCKQHQKANDDSERAYRKPRCDFFNNTYHVDKNSSSEFTQLM